MNAQIEYQKALIADLKKYRQLCNKENKACNAFSVVTNDDRTDLFIEWQNAKMERQKFCDEKGELRLAEITRLYERNKRRWMRVRSAVRSLLQEPCPVLVTLTFDDETLFGTNEETRRKYVRRYLASQTGRYFANRDFGGKNGREHYHAVCGVHIDPKEWKHGTCNVRAIKRSGSDEKEVVSRISKYIDKLTNHALKETACDRLIWSRQKHAPNFVEIDEDEWLEWLEELGG